MKQYEKLKDNVKFRNRVFLIATVALVLIFSGLMFFENKNISLNSIQLKNKN